MGFLPIFRVGRDPAGQTQFIKAPPSHDHGHHDHHGPEHLHGSPSNNHGSHFTNQLNGGLTNNRPSREQNGLPSQFNGNFGQCGRRNAEGLAGRIANPNFAEGDADFGKLSYVVTFFFIYAVLTLIHSIVQIT